MVYEEKVHLTFFYISTTNYRAFHTYECGLDLRRMFWGAGTSCWRVVASLYCYLGYCFVGDEFCCHKTKNWVFARQARNYEWRHWRRERRMSAPGTLSQLAPTQPFWGCYKAPRSHKGSLPAKIWFLKRIKAPIEKTGKSDTYVTFVNITISDLDFGTLCSALDGAKTVGDFHRVFDCEINPWKRSSRSLMSSLLMLFLLHCHES